jgi:20S proteasome subunit beta 3
MDRIGSMTEPLDFVAGGTCEEQLMGLYETVWEPNMGPEQLFKSISQSMMNAFDRYAISGWGAIVHVVEKDKVTTRLLKTRMD